MRLVFCTTDGWNAFNGINAWLLRFLPALRTRGHDARVLLFPWSRPELCTTLPALRAAGVPVDVIYPPRDTEGTVRNCLQHARSDQPDVFIANMVTPALYAAGWLREAGIPTVGLLHNDDDEYRAKARRFAGSDEFFRLSAVVAISSGLLRLVEPSPSGLLCRRIPYGQPLGAAVASWDGRSALRLVYHGRIAQEQKRIRETVAACVRVCRAARGRVLADFYGSGPDEADVKDFLAQDDAGGRVRFLGRIEAAHVASILPDYHVAVLLSDFEGLGLSILEGMAAGLVPVCHRIASGLPDLIADGQNGLFVDDRDAGFDRAIQSLLDSPDEWRRLAAAARATVAGEFSPPVSLSAWEELFTELVSTARPKRPIAIPRRIVLPPVEPALAREDSRYPGLARAVWRRLRFPLRD